MLSLRAGRAWLLAICAAAGVGCTEHGSGTEQVLTGRLRTSGALAVRAVAADRTITAAAVRSDGSFTLALPAGQRYRLEVLTTSGVRHVLGHQGSGFTALSFEVCQPVDPWDIGGIGDGTTSGGGNGCDPTTDPDCKMCDPGDPSCAPPQPCNDPMDPNCFPPCSGDPMDPNCMPPEPCDPATGTGCPPAPCMDPSDPSCKPWPCMDPSDPSCTPPEPCDPATGTSCPPAPCMDPSDPNCGGGGGCDPMADGSCWPPCQPGDPSCGTICTDPTDPNCMPPPPSCMDPTDPYCKCDANGVCPPPTCSSGDAMCPPPPPPPCSDPMDPQTCKDPCMADPATCGCAMGEPNCWPPPQPPDCNAAGMCDPGTGGMTPDHPPGDFGCQEMPL